MGAAIYVDSLRDRPKIDEADVDSAAAEALAPFELEGGENPYSIHQELQQSMNDLVGIIRKQEEMEQALGRLAEYRGRIAKMTVEGHRQFNPGWHLALDLRNIVLIAECVAQAALERQESRGGHTRDDYPVMSPEWRKVNLVCSLASDDNGERVVLVKQPMQPMREDLLALFDRGELKKYLTEEELPPEPAQAPESAPQPEEKH
jgi:succinate dehydrogenase / fumarate reductase flavoprotein subunit